MIYRKAPVQPSRFLLRVVAAAGAGALVNIAACGGDVANDGSQDNDAGSNTCSADHPCGLAPSNCGDYDATPCQGLGLIDAGLINAPEDAGQPHPCMDDAGNFTCGAMPTDAGPGGGGLIIDAGGTDE